MNLRSNLLLLGLAFGIAFAHSSVVHACDPGWFPGNGAPGLQGSVEALVSWDPDGAGPATPVLVAGGQNITYSDTGPSSNVVAYDGEQWTSLGAGVGGGGVVALAVFNNELIAGGSFTSAGGQPANRVARWDGTAWHALGTGMNSSVSALAAYNSQLYAVGSFSTAGGGAAAKIARWNGTTWSPVGTGLTGSPLAMAVANGSLFVGGLLTNAGGVTVSNLAQWNGTTWLNPAIANDMVTSLSVLSSAAIGGSSTLVLGGYFTQINSTSTLHVAMLNSSGFPSALGSGLTDPCRTVSVRRTGSGFLSYEVIATTEDLPIAPQQVWRYTPSSGAWNAMGGFDHGFAKPLVYFNGQWVVGVYDSDGITDPCVQIWSGLEWIPMGIGISGRVNAISPYGEDVVVGGEFEFVSNARFNHIARRDASTGEWSPLGTGVNNSVYAIVELPSEELIVGGDFNVAGGVIANGIARWDGATWSSLGSGMGGTTPAVHALLVMPNGDVIAGGSFTTAGGGTANRIARWNGSSWSAVGNGFSSGTVYALTVRTNGDLIAGGYLGIPPNNFTDHQVARWTGSSWVSLYSASSVGVARALVAMPNGEIIAGGGFIETPNINYVMRWNGMTWTNIDFGIEGDVLGLALQPNGNLIAVGYLSESDGSVGNGIARWNGTSWASLENGLTGNENTIPYAVAVLPNNEIAVGGDFFFAGDGVSANFARWSCGQSCVTDADCMSDAAGANDDNACNCASCDDGFCTYTCVGFGNVSCDASQLINLDDILYVLAGFSSAATHANADINPCGGNGIINLDDVLAVLSAFAGNDPCGCDSSETSPSCGSANP